MIGKHLKPARNPTRMPARMNKTAGYMSPPQQRSSFPSASRTVAVWLWLKGLRTFAFGNYDAKFEQDSWVKLTRKREYFGVVSYFAVLSDRETRFGELKLSISTKEQKNQL